MRVLLYTQHFWPEDNAPAMRWFWLAPGLADQGIKVDVITSSWRKESPEDELLPDGVTVHRVTNSIQGQDLVSRSLNEILVAIKALWLANQLARPDVVIVTAPPVGSVPIAQALMWLMRRPLVLELRDAWPELFSTWQSWADYGDGQKLSRGRRVLLRLVANCANVIMRWTRRNASLVVTTTESFAQALRQDGHRQVACIRNVPVASEAVGAPEDDGVFKVLYLGNTGRAQYLATAVRAASLVKQAGRNMRLRIVGDGAHLHALKGLARRLDAPVEFHPRVVRRETVTEYAWADSVLVMLRDWEQLAMTVPSKLYDALAVGKHISASACGETAEIISATGAGNTVSPGDAEELAKLWLRLIDEPELLNVSPSSQWLAEYADPVKLSAKYADLLRSLGEDS